jgi:hypothetical protein
MNTQPLTGEDDVPFSKFVLPNGKKQYINFKRSVETATKARELIAAGFAFECEELRTGEFYMDCCNSDDQLADELLRSTEEKGVLEAIDRLVENAYHHWKKT